jgi:hypothetical protein
MGNSDRNKQYLPLNEMRRKAPLHYWAKADNARFAAYLLRSGSCDDKAAAAAVGYNGTTSIARGEAFRREASISLELIIKAAIAQRTESGVSSPEVQRVRETHDVMTLWRDAGLPALENRDQRLLLEVKTTLIWSGRYAAPRDDDKYQDDLDLDDKLRGGPARGKLSRILTLGWDDFDRLYQIALAEFARARQRLDEQFGEFQ